MKGKRWLSLGVPALLCASFVVALARPLAAEETAEEIAAMDRAAEASVAAAAWPDFLYNKLDRLMSQREYDKAATALNEFLAKYPSSWPAMISMVGVHAKKKDMANAGKWLKKAEALPQEETYFNNLTYAGYHCELKDYANAQKFATKSLQLASKNTEKANAQLALASAYAGQSNFTAAKEWLSKAKALDPRNSKIQEMSTIIENGIQEAKFKNSATNTQKTVPLKAAPQSQKK
jgi:tetratricopeptide (TPR) repeat protein